MSDAHKTGSRVGWLFAVVVLGGAAAGCQLQRARLVASFAIQRLADPAWLSGFIAFAIVLVLLVARARRSEAGRRAVAAALVVVLVALAYAWVLSGYEGDLPYLLRLSAGRLVAHLYPLALVTAASGIAALASARADRSADRDDESKVDVSPVRP